MNKILGTIQKRSEGKGRRGGGGNRFCEGRFKLLRVGGGV